MATTTLKRSTDASSGHLKKVIQINAELFKPTSAKTRRQRAPRGGAGNKGKDKGKDAFLSLKPIVSPSQLRSKLLRRIQEHKQRALSPSASASASASAGRRAHASRRKETEAEEGENEDEDEDDGDEEEAGGGADDFQEALQFMKRRQSQQKRTATTPAATAGSHRTTARLPPLRAQAQASGPVVNTVLPPELMPEHGAGSDNGTLYVTDPVPYGCLKGGHKKTYRQWKGLAAATQGPDLVRPPTPPKRHSSPSSSSLTAPVGPRGATSMSQDRAVRLEQLQAKLRRASEKDRLASSDGSGTGSGTDADDTNAAGSRRLVKKTTKRTFTLGKSAHRRNVAVLVKDRRTIKRIHQAQQSLKQTSMHDVRRYLRQHGMMKVGSTCPPELLRKTFEASMLTGDVTNLSADVLLHNYMAREEPASE